MSGQRPPWVFVIQLPDDMLPSDAARQGLALPWGASGVGLCAEAAERVLAALPADASIYREAESTTKPRRQPGTCPDVALVKYLTTAVRTALTVEASGATISAHLDRAPSTDYPDAVDAVLDALDRIGLYPDWGSRREAEPESLPTELDEISDEDLRAVRDQLRDAIPTALLPELKTGYEGALRIVQAELGRRYGAACTPPPAPHPATGSGPISLDAAREARATIPNVECPCGSQWWHQPVTVSPDGKVTGYGIQVTCMECGKPGPDRVTR